MGDTRTAVASGVSCNGILSMSSRVSSSSRSTRRHLGQHRVHEQALPCNFIAWHSVGGVATEDADGVDGADSSKSTGNQESSSSAGSSISCSPAPSASPSPTQRAEKTAGAASGLEQRKLYMDLRAVHGTTKAATEAATLRQHAATPYPEKQATTSARDRAPVWCAWRRSKALGANPSRA